MNIPRGEERNPVSAARCLSSLNCRGVAVSEKWSNVLDGMFIVSIMESLIYGRGILLQNIHVLYMGKYSV